ncbi:MAG: hypothetical protein A2167_02985 [Planctomycetes bacterium RBG_13_46_10]|nr:MAG: hypothetical protein A2167_02985 [Planctomycetes bacterium RBG_13_46_10]
MIKKTLVVLAVLISASVANADLVLNLNEAGNTITISGDGTTIPPTAAYLFIEGPGSITGGSIVYPGSLSTYDELEDIAAILSMSPQDTLDVFRTFISRPSLADLSLITLADGAIPPAPLQGILVEGIGLTMTGPVMLTLISDDFMTVFDTKYIAAPEPLTIALLGIGSLFLRRRR